MLLTVAAIVLHIIAMRAAGPLWRDEANTLALATLPSVSEVWENLQYDSFPFLWIFLVRQAANIFGPMNDQAFRVIGFVMGVGGVAALWVSARSFGHRLPLVALALFALSPSVVRWGDSFRAYGLGIVLAILAIVCVWRFATTGRRTEFVLATLVALLSVHITYYNATVLFAACAGGIAVCAMGRQWKRALPVFGIGALAAVSLIPNVQTIRRLSEWSSLVQIRNYDFPWFLLKLGETLEPAGNWAMPLWFGVLLLSLWAGVSESVRNRLGLSERDRQVLCYSCVTLAVGAITYFLFLKTLAYLTQPWYYLTLLAIAATCIDAIAGVLIKNDGSRIGRIMGVVTVACFTVYAGSTTFARMTTADIAAARLEAIGARDDLVIVNPWYSAVSFARYYDGPAEWTTMPPLESHRVHRYDLFGKAMQAADQATPALPVLRDAARVLQAGGTVYVVGGLDTSSRRGVLPPAQLPEDGWKSPHYHEQWGQMLGRFLNQNALSLRPVPLAPAGRINEYETLGLFEARGWRR